MGKKLDFEVRDEATNEIPHQYLEREEGPRAARLASALLARDGLKRTIDWYSSSCGARMTETIVACRACGAGSLTPILSLGRHAARERAAHAGAAGAGRGRRIRWTSCCAPRARWCRSRRPCRVRSCSASISTSRRSPTRCCGTRRRSSSASSPSGGLGQTEAAWSEIASNDGYLLQYYKKAGVPVLGVEPARNIARVAESKGIPTVCEFFGARCRGAACGGGKARRRDPRAQRARTRGRLEWRRARDSRRCSRREAWRSSRLRT